MLRQTSTPTLQEAPSYPVVGSAMNPEMKKFISGRTFEGYVDLSKKYGSFYSVVFPAPIGKFYMIQDPEEMTKIMRSEGAHPNGAIQSHWPMINNAIKENWAIAKGGGGIWSQGPEWKRLRSFMQADLLQPAAAKGYIDNMLQAAALASKGASGSADSMNQYFARTSFDLFHSVMFGRMSECADLATETAPDNLEFCENMLKLTDLLLPMIQSPYEGVMNNVLGIETSKSKEIRQYMKRGIEIAEKKMDAFMERKQAGELNELEAASYLSHMIERQEDPNNDITVDEMKGLATFGYMASVDTTSSVLNWCLIHLATNPDLQERLAVEAAATPPSKETIGSKKLYPLLHAVIREQHRLTPALPVSILKKNSKEDITVHGVHMPKGSLFFFDSHSAHMNPELVPEPEVFRPERWFPSEVEARVGTPSEVIDHVLAAGPFSAGARRCPGSRVANFEVHVLLLTFLREWKFTLEDPSLTWKDIDYSQGTTCQPTMPKFIFTPR